MKTKVMIEGMSCGNCVSHTQKALSEVAGVDSVTVNLAEKTAEIESAERLDEKLIVAAVEAAGYLVSSIEQG
jgi:copper chaperone CopZ